MLYSAAASKHRKLEDNDRGLSVDVGLDHACLGDAQPAVNISN